MRVAFVALRIRCLQKSIEIVDVLKTNGKAMILYDFSVDSVRDRLRFFFFGFVLSLRDGELRSKSWSP